VWKARGIAVDALSNASLPLESVDVHSCSRGWPSRCAQVGEGTGSSLPLGPGAHRHQRRAS